MKHVRMRALSLRCLAYWLVSLVSCLLIGCTHSLSVNWAHASPNQDSRVQFIVVHATELDFPASLRALTQGNVSSHYLVDRDGTIYGLVPESRRAWHAGPSYWQGSTPLNPSSIGIEIVSVPLGEPEATEVEFPSVQIAAVEKLIADIGHRHGIRPDRIVGHGEVQPDSRTDPGQFFPWTRLEKLGLVPTPDASKVERFRREFTETGLPDTSWIQERLSQHGYQMVCTGRLDEHTKQVLAVFQSRYRQSLVSGEPDDETIAILATLTSPDGLILTFANAERRLFKVEPPLHSHCKGS